jgi:hypothetical protein
MQYSPVDLPSGGNVSIDFSNLEKDNDYIVEFQSIDGNPHAALFPQVNLVMVANYDVPPFSGQSTTFSQVTENEWLIHGIQFDPGEVPDVYSSPQVDLIFPITEGMQETTSSITTETYYFGFNEIDSVRSVINRTLIFESDTWGELILPNATYDFIQVTETGITEDSTFNLINGEWVFQDVNSYSNSSFHFYSPEAHGSVLSITEAEGFKGEPVWNVIFLENSIVTSNNMLDNQNTLVFPVPANDFLKIQVREPDFDFFKLTDISGKIVSEGALESSEINVKQHPDGLYFLHLFNRNLRNSVTKKVIIHHEQ